MNDSENRQKRGNQTGNGAIDRFLRVIGYPEKMSDVSSLCMLRVDGIEVSLFERNGSLVLAHAFPDDGRMLPTLASYAAGRILKEDALLAYGDAPGFGKAKVFLWQEASADAAGPELLRLFEGFMNSCDWWRDRVAALSGIGGADSDIPKETMVIMP